MAKKAKKKSAAKEKQTQQQDTEVKPENKTDSFDFGGLPQRDLKKNLGCG